MSIQANVVSKISVVETFTGEYISPSDPTITVDGLSDNLTYTGTTTVPVTKQTAFQLPLVAGAASIDLASLPDVNGVAGAVVGTGLKVQVAKFRNLTDNAAVITIAEGAANGYALLGATFTLKLLPGQSFLFIGDDAAPDVASGDRILDITGTGVEILECAFILG